MTCVGSFCFVESSLVGNDAHVTVVDVRGVTSSGGDKVGSVAQPLDQIGEEPRDNEEDVYIPAVYGVDFAVVRIG